MTTTTTNWETVRHEGEVYKVLNDHAGTLTVTEWREQLEEYAEHICDKTGLELLKGIAPPCTPGHKIDKAALVGTISELFKRSTKKFCETWLQDEPGGTTTALTTAGGIEFAMRTRAVTEDTLRMVKETLRGGSNAYNHLVSLMRRKDKEKIDHLGDFHKYSTTTMIQGAAGAKSTVGELIKKMQVVKIDRTGDMPNPYDNGAEAFASKFEKYDPECRDIQLLFAGLDGMCQLYNSLASEDPSETLDTSWRRSPTQRLKSTRLSSAAHARALYSIAQTTSTLTTACYASPTPTSQAT